MSVPQAVADAIVLALSSHNLSDDDKKKVSVIVGFMESAAVSSACNALLRQAMNLAPDDDVRTLLERVVNEVSIRPFRNVNADLLEVLAELEHHQWVMWSRAVSDEVSEKRRKRWESFWVEYDDLPDSVKNHDRLWAKSIVLALQPTIEQVRTEQYEKFVEYLKHAMEVHYHGQFDDETYQFFRNNVLGEVLNQVQQERLGE